MGPLVPRPDATPAQGSPGRGRYNPRVNAAAVDWIVERVLAELAQERDVPPEALLLLLRQYALTGRTEVGDALGLALARTIEDADREMRASVHDSPSATLIADQLLLLVEAAGLSEDERLLKTVAHMLAHIESTWPASGALAPA